MTTTRDAVAAVRRLRVLVLEPSELVREGIAGALGACDDLMVDVDPQASEQAAGRPPPFAARGPPPDVVLMGADPSRREDLEAIRQVSQDFTGTAVVVLATDAALAPFLAAVREGARGYLLRTVRGAALAEAVRVTAYGGSAIDPLVARRLLDRVAALPLLGGGTGPDSVDDGALAALSRREGEVLQSLAQGMSNKEIAARMRLSIGTVKTHLRHIYRKLGVADRTSAALAAIRTPMHPLAR